MEYIMELKALDEKINGLLVVLDLGRVALSGNNNRSDRRAIFKCSCNNEFTASVQNVKSGATTSCGCFKMKTASLRRKTHGLTNTRLFSIWQNMRNRCNNKNADFYMNYGGRGITVCNEWNGAFLSFYEWALSNGYEESLTIDRIDNNDGYKPENCQWISKAENSSKDKKGKSTNPNIKNKIKQIKKMLNDGASMNKIVITMNSSKYLIRKIKDGYNG
jgi:hypothetical protein